MNDENKNLETSKIDSREQNPLESDAVETGSDKESHVEIEKSANKHQDLSPKENSEINPEVRKEKSSSSKIDQLSEIEMSEEAEMEEDSELNELREELSEWNAESSAKKSASNKRNLKANGADKSKSNNKSSGSNKNSINDLLRNDFVKAIEDYRRDVSYKPSGLIKLEVDKATFFIDFNSKQNPVSESHTKKPDSEVSLSLDTFEKLVNNQLNTQMGLLKHLIKVEGDFSTSQRLFKALEFL